MHMHVSVYTRIGDPFAATADDEWRRVDALARLRQPPEPERGEMRQFREGTRLCAVLRQRLQYKRVCKN